MSANVLVVPIRVDVLKLDVHTPVAGRTAQFDRMPFADGARKANEKVPPLWAEISAPPSGDIMILEPGIHLHWALPDALTRGTSEGDTTAFPAVPNRWLVLHRTRTASNLPFTAASDAWVIESDRLSDRGEPWAPVVPAEPRPGRPQPWAALGRAVPLHLWREEPQAERLSPLTAMGWGLPSFAASYAECRGVFGFCIPGAPGQVWHQIDVVGWYGDVKQDGLWCAVRDLVKVGGGSCDLAALDAMLGERFGWAALEGAPAASSPTASIEELRTLCFGRVTLEPAFLPAGSALEETVNAVAIANSGTEALSAVLAEGDHEAEEQLEALHLAARFEHVQQDVGAAFAEARHEHAFSQAAGGASWTIEVRSTAAPEPDPEKGRQPRAAIPAAFADRLEELNDRERAWEEGSLRVETLRQRLYADWYRHVLVTPPRVAPARCPDAAKVRRLVDRGVADLGKALADTGAITFEASADGCTAAVAGDAAGGVAASPGSLAGELAAAVNRAAADLAAWNASPGATESGTRLVLRRVPGARYWRPSDPVVGLVGFSAMPSAWRGQGGSLRTAGRLECWTSSFGFAPPVQDTRQIQTDFLQAIQRRAEVSMVQADAQLRQVLRQEMGLWGYPAWESAGSVAFSRARDNTWEPVSLQWEVEHVPLAADEGRGPYSVGFLSSSFALDENAVDLHPTGAAPGKDVQGTIHCGTTILSRHAAEQLRARIEAYVTSEVLPDYYEDRDVPEAERTDAYFAARYRDVLGWWAGKTKGSALRAVAHAYEMLRGDNWSCLTATLDGFHDGLLTARRAMQLPIQDPAGSPEQQALAGRVRELDDEESTASPLPAAPFHPIRTGLLRLRRLRLVDNFGCFRDVQLRRVISPASMAVPGDPGAVLLPPRLCQAARLDFGFLRAGTNAAASPHPAASPVAGWLVVNHLDGSVVFHGKLGRMLGSVDARGTWQERPGRGGIAQVSGLRSAPLRAVAEYLIRRAKASPSFMASFIASLTQALDSIDADGESPGGATALLVGRPIAVVRAAIDLQLRGAPATSLRWDALAAEAGGAARDDRGVPAVKLQIRLGEFSQLDDGLVGYWLEDAKGGFAGDVLYAPQTSREQSDFIRSRTEDPMSLFQTIAAPPQRLTMLVDPRGAIHATAGILPVASIRLAPQHYVGALEAIEASFQIAPLLVDPATLDVPLPREPELEWTWTQRGSRGWDEPVALESKADRDARGPLPLELREGWLRLRSTGAETDD